MSVRRGEGASLLRLSFLLVCVELLSFVPYLHRHGFYVDDWAVLKPLLRSSDQSLRGLLGAFHAATGSFYYLRPLDLLSLPALYWWAGLALWKYQVAILLLETAGALFVFHALHKAVQNKLLCFLTACLFIVYPNHGATHHWYNAGAAGFVLSMAFCSAAFWSYSLWLENGSTGSLVLSLVLFAMGDLVYEGVLPLGLLMPLLCLLRDARLARSARESLRNAARAGIPVAAAGAALFAYHVMIQRVYPQTISRKMMFDPRFMAKVLGRGFECSSTGILHLFWVSVFKAVHDIGGVLWLAGAAAIALLLRHLRARCAPDRPGPQVTRIWAYGSLALFLAAYGPYAISADQYMPHIFDVQNRINAPASLACAMLLALAVVSIGGLASRGSAGRMNAPQIAALALALGVSTVINWENSYEWGRSWAIQQQILTDINSKLSRLPPRQGTVVYLRGAPDQIGTAPGLNAPWAFDAALQDFARNWDLRGDVWESHGPSAELPKGDGNWIYRFDQDPPTMLPFR